MADDTKVFQDMADAMLPLFDDMPQVVVLVKDHEAFQREPFPLAIYMAPNIVINPAHARTCTFEEMQDTICHELIHAWTDWNGLLGVGEHLDSHHNEWFVKKALEINKKKIRNLKVDLDRLLLTREAIDIYSRVASIRFAPHLRHKGRRIRAYLAGLGQMFLEYERFSKVVIIGFSVLVVGLLLNKAKLVVIPRPLASFLWIGWTAAVVIWYAMSNLRQRRH